ncbi:hypothetical protein GCM10023324_55130 [Streptomyces youssoufiensis]
MWRSARLAMPLARRRVRLRLPHPPFHSGAPAEEGAAECSAPIDPDLSSADIRIGYASCSTLGQELDSQLYALSKHGIPRDKVHSEKSAPGCGSAPASRRC